MTLITEAVVAKALKRALPDVEWPAEHRFDVFEREGIPFVVVSWPGGPTAPQKIFRIDMQFVEVEASLGEIERMAKKIVYPKEPG